MSNECDGIFISKYAPVIIPTLCRYEHFRACLESLSRCILADKTDVYIGLDYPAKNSHWEGYNKICDYLTNVKLNFKSLTILKRSQNMGLGLNGNYAALERFVLEKYDRFIGSEDDNVFSPNFLVYMNKGLEKFKDDKTVLAINGYRHFYPIRRKENTYIRQNVDFSAWGYGFWRDRKQKINDLDVDYFRNMFSIKKFFNIYRENGCKRALDFYSYAFAWNGIMSDSPISIYAKLENMNVVMPAELSLVRNMGWDNSGEHCLNDDQLAQMHTNQQISKEDDFVYIGSGFEFYKENRKIFRDCSYARISNWKFWMKCAKVFAKYFLWKAGFYKG